MKSKFCEEAMKDITNVIGADENVLSILVTLFSGIRSNTRSNSEESSLNEHNMLSQMK